MKDVKDKRRADLFVAFLMMSFVFYSQMFGFDFLQALVNAFNKTMENQVIPIGIGVIFVIGFVLLFQGVPFTKVLMLVCFAGACLVLATKAPAWFVEWGDNFESNYGGG